MKYVMLFAGPTDGPATDDAGYQKIHDEIMEWWGTHMAAGTIVGGDRLQPAATATTLRNTGGAALELVDGPFIEAKEEVSGYGVIEVADLDAALALARTWPLLQVPGQTLELRPVLEM